MFEILSVEYYYEFYIYFAFFLVIANLLHTYTVDINDPKNIRFLRSSGIVLMVLIILYIGLRPISGRYFGDMITYNRYYTNYFRGASVEVEKDIVFHYFMKTLSNFMPVRGFFMLIAFLYVIPMYLVSKTHFKEYWFYAFLMFVVSYSYISYGTNGIRNGVASSFFLWGLCHPKNKIKMYLIFGIAVLFHKTLLLPVLAYSITLFHNNPKTFLKGWLVAIPLSIALGGLWIMLFTSLGFGDERLEGYLNAEMEGQSPGFRWDFLFYSFFPVFSGWYFIIKRKYKDQFYYHILNTYLICNAFWILVIKANYSNRFAYLSWFMMAIVIIYPLLKQQFFKNQQIIISKVVSAYFLFTYFMVVLYYLIKEELR